MNRSKGQRRGKKENNVKIKVTRCTMHNQPMFEHEVCKEFVVKTNGSDMQKNCRNCKYSF